MNVTQKPHLHQDWIDPHAIGIVRALQKAGHITYLVGGCVRDLLINIHPKDYDIATTAMPDEVRKIIYRAYVIGKRFKLVLVRREDQQFEVATFRREVREEEITEENPASDNVFGTPEEDARRRDFTINGLFYDPINDQLIDFADGLPDLEKRVVRMIGDPQKRLLEDPIRILRAIRLKHMIHFTLDDKLREAMEQHASCVASAVLPRRREEILKWLRLPDPSSAFIESYDLGVLQHLSPTLYKYCQDHANGCETFWSYLRHFHDWRVDKQNPADVFAMLVHAFVRSFLQTDCHQHMSHRDWENLEPLHKWMREELGMFKMEQALVLKALQMQSLLAKRSEFERRGERRRNAVLQNEAFALAMRIAEKDFSLSPQDFYFWQNHSEGVAKSEGDRPRRRRRARRPRKPRTENVATKSGEEG